MLSLARGRRSSRVLGLLLCFLDARAHLPLRECHDLSHRVLHHQPHTHKHTRFLQTKKRGQEEDMRAQQQRKEFDS
jgi:hypothetical protein